MPKNEEMYYANPEQFRPPPDYGTDPAGLFPVLKTIFAFIGVVATVAAIGYLWGML